MGIKSIGAGMHYVWGSQGRDLWRDNIVQKLEGSHRKNPVEIWEKKVLGRGDHKCKGPDRGASFVCLMCNGQGEKGREIGDEVRLTVEPDHKGP